MKKLLSNNKTRFLFITIIIVIVSSLAISANNDSLMYLNGQEAKSIQDKNDNTVVASINDSKITNKGFESYKLLINSGKDGDMKLTDKAIIDTMLERELIYSEALKNKFEVSDNTVDEAISVAREELAKDAVLDKQISDYISGQQITEEQYWEMAKPAYRKALICGQYKNSLKQAYAKGNDIKDYEQLTKKFDEYYKSFIKDLKSKSRVEYYKTIE